MSKKFTDKGWELLIPINLLKGTKVLEFLKKGYPKAYRIHEIQERLGGSRSSIQHHVSRLFLKGLIDRKSPFYRFKRKFAPAQQGEENV